MIGYRRIEVHRLPAYAPELNPSECIWGHLKNQEVASFCAKHRWELSMRATAALRRMRRRLRLVEAFWKQTERWRDSHSFTRHSIGVSGTAILSSVSR